MKTADKLFYMMLFLFFITSRFYSVSLEDVKYFPMSPDYRFTLCSETTKNTVTGRTKIYYRKDDLEEAVYSWNLEILYKNREIKYQIIFFIDESGDISLFKISSGDHEHYYSEPLTVYPYEMTRSLNQPIQIGQNIILTHLKKIDEINIGETTYKDLVQSRLQLGSREIFITTAMRRGIVSIETDSEIFILQ